MQSINCDDKSSSSCESAVKISSSIPESPLKKHRKRTEIKLQPKELLPFSPGSIASQRIKRNELEYTPSSSTILEIEKEISLQEKINGKDFIIFVYLLIIRFRVAPYVL